MRDSRTVLALKKEKNNINQNLRAAKLGLGHQLFLNTTLQVFSKNEKKTYFYYNENSEKCRNDIKKIRDLAQKLWHLYKALSESDDIESALIGQWEIWYKTLGQMMYRHYIPLLQSVFDEHYTKIQAQLEKLDEAEKAAKDLKDSMLEQGFFSKLFSQVKYISATNTVESYITRYNILLEKAGKAAYEDTELSLIINNEEIHDSIRRAYNTCCTLEEDIAKEHAKGIKTSEEITDVKKQMEKLSATALGEKRTQQLGTQIDENSKKQDEYAITKADEIANRYMDENGVVTKEFPSECGANLNTISNLRNDRVSIDRRIQIQCLIEKISSANRELASNTKKINANTKKIKTLSTQNTNLDEKNKILKQQTEEWQNVKVGLDLAEATNVKQIGKNPY
ncbi:MAG TPA: hypothetical protein VFC68_01090 [Treponemataceae bacterium]|nr:hypothetical protein [Treponemataceae bacterium]